MKGRNGVAGGRGYTIGTRTNKRITREGERGDGERGGRTGRLLRQNFLSITDNASPLFFSFSTPFFPPSTFSFTSREREREKRNFV